MSDLVSGLAEELVHMAVNDEPMEAIVSKLRDHLAEAFNKGIEAAEHDCDCVGTDLRQAHQENPYG